MAINAENDHLCSSCPHPNPLPKGEGTSKSVAAPPPRIMSASDPRKPTDFHETAMPLSPNLWGNVECSRCKSANAADRNFCGQCGEPLWNTCPQCAERNHLDQRYCSHCGTALHAAAGRLQGRFESVWQTARRLRDQCLFDEALDSYRQLTKLGEPGIEDLVKQTNALIYQCVLERDRLRREAEEAGRRARHCLKSNDFRQAAALLASVPAALATEDLRQLREEVRQGLAEIRRLQAAVQAAQTAPLSFNLLRKLGRFLELCPGDPEACGLKSRLQKELKERIESCLAGCRYERVAELLEGIPRVFFEDSLSLLEIRARELHRLVWDLRHAPAADAVLAALARRFQQLAPHDEKNRALCRTLERRLAKHARDKRPGALPWAAPPERTALGPPVDWLRDVGRIVVAARADAADVLAAPGRFALACGLALQEVDLAPIGWNFLSCKKSFLKRLAAWNVLGKSPTAWGLDLGCSALKAVKLRRVSGSPGCRLEAGVCIEHRKPLGQTTHEEEYRAVVGETLKAFFSRFPRGNEWICLGLSSVPFFFRQFELPPMPADKVPAAVQFEARHRFPAALKDLVWDYLVFPSLDPPSKADVPRRITIAGAKIPLLTRRLEMLAEGGLKPDVVQCGAAALYNFTAWNFFLPSQGAEASKPAAPPPPRACVDLGGETMHFVVCGPGLFWERSFPIGADRLNRLLVREFNLTFAQAEGWKRNPDAAPDFGKLSDVLQAGFADVVQSLSEAAEAYEKAYPDAPLSRYLTVGGGFLVHGLLRYLWHQR
ncbi:MAG: pilus assembly protein PilM [Pirellulales bacterium]|nr:pilus assembly protein PilM [Pirellulales bacterium]